MEDTAEKQVLNTDQNLKSVSDLFSKDSLAEEVRD